MSDSLSSRKLRLRPFPTEFSGIPAYNPRKHDFHVLVLLEHLDQVRRPHEKLALGAQFNASSCEVDGVGM